MLANALGDARRRNVLALHPVALVVLIDLALEFVAARLAEHLALHAWCRHLGALADRAEEHFLERAVVDVEAGAAGAFRRVDAFDEHAVLPRVAVRRVAALRAGAIAADVEAVHRHRRRRREERPEVARVRNPLQRLELEVLLNARVRRIDHRRIAGDRDGLLQRRDRELDVDRRAEAHRNLDVFALQSVEARQLERDRIRAGRQRGESIIAAGIRHRRLHAHHRGAGDGDRHSRQHAAARIRHFPVDRTRGARAAALGERRTGRQPAHSQQRDENLKTTPHFPSCAEPMLLRRSTCNRTNTPAVLRVGDYGQRPFGL